MQAYHARQLFPCFDEPGLRAVFELSVIHKNNYTTVLGNSDIRETVAVDDSFTKTTFNPTVPMATYLFAMLVSDFDHVNATEGVFKVPVRVGYYYTNIVQIFVICNFLPNAVTNRLMLHLL